MPSMLQLKAAKIETGEHLVHVRLSFVNTTGEELGPGGLRFIAVDKSGQEQKVSATSFWSTADGETIQVVAHLGHAIWSERTVRLQSFAYVEFSGRILDLASTVTVGFMQGTNIKNES